MPQPQYFRWILFAGVLLIIVGISSISAWVFFTKVSPALTGQGVPPSPRSSPITAFRKTKSGLFPGMETVSIPDGKWNNADDWMLVSGFHEKYDSFGDSDIYLAYFIPGSEAPPQRYAEAVLSLDFISTATQLSLNGTGEIATILENPENYRRLDAWASDSGTLLIYFQSGEERKAFTIYAPQSHIKRKHAFMKFLSQSIREYDKPDSVFTSISDIKDN